MITLNGTKFAASEQEFTGSLFTDGDTCSGYYKPLKHRVNLLDKDKNLIGVITKHKVLAQATKLSNGSYWYNHGDIPLIGRYESHLQMHNEVQNVVYDHLLGA